MLKEIFKGILFKTNGFRIFLKGFLRLEFEAAIYDGTHVTTAKHLALMYIYH